MGFTISYDMCLRELGDTSAAIEKIIDKAEQLGWEYERAIGDGFNGVVIETGNDECETISIVFECLNCEGFVKYLGIDEDFIWKIFNILWLLKPYMERLDVIDDYGLWYEFVSQIDR